MSRVIFDLDVLRSFVVGVELGSFARAADRLGRSTSAVSAQLKKLEEQAGRPILRKSGRGLVLTPAGETLLAYARRMLELNDEAATALRGVDLEGWIRLGMQEDFGERLLPAVLGRFARAHPKVRIEARVARNAELLDLVGSAKLDLALAWDGGTPSPYASVVGTLPMRWIAPRHGLGALAWTPGEPIPLVAFESPCLMRQAATTALDRAGIPWRLAFTSASLAGIWAAVAAGLGVTVRTEAGLPDTLSVVESGAGAPCLPTLPALGLLLHRAEAEPADAVRRLEDILLHELAQILRDERGPSSELSKALAAAA